MSQKICPNCGAELKENANFCRACGYRVNEPEQSDVKRCLNCGNELKPGAKFCRLCGAAVAVSLEENESNQVGFQEDDNKNDTIPEKKTISKETDQKLSEPEKTVDPVREEETVSELNAETVKQEDEPKKKLNIGLILAIAAILIAAGIIFYPKLKGTNAVVENTPTTPAPQPTEETEPTEEPVTYSTIDLTDALNDVDVFHKALHGLSVGDQNSYENWYQSPETTYGYGNYKGSQTVDSFWTTDEELSVFGVSLNLTRDEAEEVLTEGGWSKEDQSGSITQFRKDDLTLTIVNDSNDGIKKISFDRDQVIAEPATEEAPSGDNTADDSQSESSSSDDYFFPNSLDEYISESQLYGMTARELTLARNEVYARYGYTFQRQDLQEYFNSKSWYKADPAVNKNTIGNYVSAIGMKNMVMIREYQKAHGLTY